MIDIQSNIPLAPLTSYKIGGPARHYLSASLLSDIVAGLAWAHEHGETVLMLGRGSNLLVSDSGFAGLVIDTSATSAISWDRTTAHVAGGTALHDLVRAAVDRGMGGMEELCGIPGTVGGGIIMNAGAFSQTISDCVVAVEVVERDGTNRRMIEKKDIEFSYRNSSIKADGSIILSATFSFIEGDLAKLTATFDDIQNRRREKQPLDLPSCGSVFKRPPGGYAGTLIESCGLKGFTIGGAQVSEKHTNFIVNIGSATANDVRSLIVHIQKTVLDQTGTILAPEVIFIGEFGVDIL